jgi:hypothetical protein
MSSLAELAFAPNGEANRVSVQVLANRRVPLDRSSCPCRSELAARSPAITAPPFCQGFVESPWYYLP